MALTRTQQYSNSNNKSYERVDDTTT
uniref:Uncharacterized protein n=1 Tax=Arundo donax TaxID=35708 RepID=A0A0A9BLP6_ARUDO